MTSTVRITFLFALATWCAGCPGRPSYDVVESDVNDVAVATDAADAALDSEATDAGVPLDAEASVPMRVLFVGNSYTYVNDLPGTVRALADATPGITLDIDSVTQGGASLATHWETTGARDRIAAGGWNAVVLQGQSVEPLLGADDFTFFAQLFATAVQDVGARPIWYATWARRAGDPIYASTGLDPMSMAEGLDAAYRSVATQYGGFVARVGTAWALASAELPAVNLYADDGSHPSPAGTLLAACVMFQAIANTRAVVPDPPPLGVPRDVAVALCDLAPRVECIESTSRCGDTCARLDRDPANCGACGAACGAPRACTAGSCRCPTVQLSSPTSMDLATIEPMCDASVDPYSAACRSAMHRQCAMRDCADTGYIQMPTTDGVFGTCIAAEVQDITYDPLRALVPGCDGTTMRDGAECAIASHRYCVSRGAIAGYGPITAGPDHVHIACVRDHATIVHTTYERLSQIRTSCNGVDLRWGGDCSFASYAFCRSSGHASGFGPTESSGPDVDVVCLDP